MFLVFATVICDAIKSLLLVCVCPETGLLGRSVPGLVLEDTADCFCKGPPLTPLPAVGEEPLAHTQRRQVFRAW